MSNKDTYIKTFVQHYLIAALWAECDDNEEPFDQNYDVTNIAADSIIDATIDCSNFVNKNWIALQHIEAEHGHDAEKAGHDFWLTRKGHGVGFWDRDLSTIGEMLTESCKEFGDSINVFVNDGEITIE